MLFFIKVIKNYPMILVLDELGYLRESLSTIQNHVNLCQKQTKADSSVEI